MSGSVDIKKMLDEVACIFQVVEVVFHEQGMGSVHTFESRDNDMIFFLTNLKPHFPYILAVVFF